MNPAAQPLDPALELSEGQADDSRLVRVVQEYLAAIESGARPNRAAFLARHADLAGPLAECLDALDFVHHTAPRLAPGPDATFDLSIPLGDFRVVREAGRGGMGIVYEAEQLSLGRRIALKVLPAGLTLDPRNLQRFKTEAQAAALLHHANIVPVYSVGCERGVHFYAMQFIEGRSLARIVQEMREGGPAPAWAGTGTKTKPPHPNPPPRGGREPIPIEGVSLPGGALSPSPLAGEGRGGGAAPRTRWPRTVADFDAVARLGLQAAEALAHAHDQGVVHRDVKPANLLVDGIGHLWVTDFGLARVQADAALTITGDLLGTLRFMSPEQALGKRGLVDHRTDVYSLGATLYELLTLRPAFDGQDRQELLRQIAFEEPVPPGRVNRSVPRDLETVVLRATAKAPEERYTTAQDLADDLRRFLERRPVLARRPSLLDRARKWSVRHRSLAAALVALLLTAVVGLTTSTVLVAREQARTQAAYEAESRQRERAEASLKQAREALDFFAQVSDEELPETPELRGVRRKLLEASLGYLQSFIDQCGDDPSLKGELAASHLRVARILDEIGSREDALAALERARAVHEQMVRENPTVPEYQRSLAAVYSLSLSSAGPLRLLVQKSVQDDLKLTEDQVRRIMEKAEVRTPPARGSLPFLLPADWEAREKAALAVLTEAQDRRLRQIALQVRGAQALGDAEVAEALGFTEAQKERVRGLVFDGRRFSWGPGSGGPGGRRSDEARKAPLEQALEVLTPEQRAKWNEMTGEPFRGELRYGGPGGPGFGPGRKGP
jgi:eukaryotic-like serine/threonine-protein kinase